MCKLDWYCKLQIGKMDMANPQSVVILGTGGTIAGRATNTSDNIGYTAAQVSASQLVAQVPGLQGVPLQVEQVVQIDSKDMRFTVWQSLLARVMHYLAQADVQGIVITHGTDTLEETAFFLSAALNGSKLLNKPVVLTCAMRPATSQAPDGPQNLWDAVTVACDVQACGVIVVCAGVVHSAVDVQKMHTYRVDAFSSGDSGPLGFVEESCVRWVRLGAVNSVLNSPQALENNTDDALQLIVSRSDFPRVDIVLNHADADGRMVDLLLMDRVSRAKCGQRGAVQGIVVAGTGNGTVHVDLQAALFRAVEAGVRVLRSSRCAQGRIIESAASKLMGQLPSAGGLSPVKARIALMLQLLGE